MEIILLLLLFLFCGTVSVFPLQTSTVSLPRRRRRTTIALSQRTNEATPPTLVNIEESAPRDIAALEEWAEACGVQRAAGLQLIVTPNDDNDNPNNNEQQQHVDISCQTTEPLEAASPVLFVPNQMILSAQQVKQEWSPLVESTAIPQLFTTLQMTADHQDCFYLFLKVLLEYQQGMDSPWFPWLNALPKYYSNGAAMTHFCCTNCLPPFVGNLALQERTRFRQFFKALDYLDDTVLSKETKVHKALTKW